MKKLLLNSILVLSLSFVYGSISAQTINTGNTSDPNTCDGWAIVNDSSAINPTSVYWTSGGMIVQQGGFQIYGLCAGTYIFNYDAGFGNQMYTFVIEAGAFDPCASLYASMTWNNPTDSMACDGSAIVSVFGGTPGYTFMWSNGSTTQNQSAMCPGVYYCTVMDANGCSYTLTASIGVTNSNDSTIIIDNNTYPDSVVVDTLGTETIEDCIIDFTVIDSVYINNFYYTSLDSLLVSWVVIDNMGYVVAVFNVPYGVNGTPNGVYSIYLTIYCPQKSNEINTIYTGDQIFLEASQLGVNEESTEDFKVLNPMGNELQLYFSSSNERTITLLDLNGKVLINEISYEVNSTISTSNLLQGMYILNVTENGITTSRKVIK